MAESKVRNESYYQVNGWMLNRLELKGIELDVYAIIYGFSQDGESSFTGSLQYLSDFTNTTRPTVIKALKSLVEKGYIVKHESQVNGVKFNTYQANLQVVKNLYWGSKEILLGGSKETLPGGSKEILPNNKSLNNKDLDNKEDKEESAPSPPAYGEFKNVFLSDEELEKVKTKFPTDWKGRIENLSTYMKQTGKTYQSHYATILNWARMDEEKAKSGQRYRGGQNKGCKEIVPAWMQEEKKDDSALAMKLIEEMNAGKPDLSERAASLRQKLGQT